MKKSRIRSTTYYPLLVVTGLLLAIGTITYISASFGLFAKNEHLFWVSVIKHIGLGVLGGIIVMLIVAKIPISFWKKYAFFFYIASILVTLLVFVPGIGFSHGGATRWISLKIISFQPVELLKLGTVLFLAKWLADHHTQIRKLKYFVVYLLFLVPVAAILIKQPDTSSMVLIALVSISLIFLRGAKWKHVLGASLLGIILLGGFIYTQPYIQRRFDIYFHPEKDPFGDGFQLKQSRIAIGSGQFFGRGLGQGTHKYGPYLPESSSDSIFAIFAEETGFLGSMILHALYFALALFGIRTAKRARSLFAQNLAVGITLLIVVQSILNIATISGVIPLSGFPLIFLSGGGTALLISLAEIGMLLAIAREEGKRKVRKKVVREKKDA